MWKYKKGLIFLLQFKLKTMKHILLLILILFHTSSFCIKVFAQQPNTLPKNEFGLFVVTNKTQYLASINTDENNKMVAFSTIIPNCKTEFVYATTKNFTLTALYKKPIAYLRKDAAVALIKVADALGKRGLGIKIFDAYRPYSVTKKMWQIVPDDNYAANPAYGSGHNRGIAVDLTLYNLSTDKDLQMPTLFDDFSEKAHHNYMQLDSIIIANRNLLKNTMEQFGFKALATEWWHYSFVSKIQYDLVDLSFKQLRKIVK